MKFVIKILFTAIFTLTFFPNAYAITEDNSLNKYDSMYRYGALENKTIFINFPNNNVNNMTEESFINNELSDNFIEKLQDIIDKQNLSTKEINNSLKNIKDRSKIITFLIGNRLGILKFQMVQTKDQVILLETLALGTEYIKNEIQINSQIKLSKEEQEKVENFIYEKEKEFSLFGWLASSL